MGALRKSLVNVGRGEQLFSSLFIVLLLLMGALFSLGVNANASAEEVSPSIQLTESEQAWLAEHKKIRLAFDGYWPPYSFINKRGEYEGLVVDYVELVTERLGIELEFYQDGKWDKLFEAAKHREVDLVATMVKRPEREEWFAFSDPFITMSSMLITRRDDERFSSRSDIAGRTVALVKGYFHVRQILDEFPSITPYYVDDVLGALIAVSTGKADVTVEAPGVVNYLAKQYAITNLKFPALYDRDVAKQGFGVRKDWPELVPILNKALDSVTEQERQSIFNRWITEIRLPAEVIDDNRPLSLTVEEQQWIEQHPVVRVAPDPHFHPVEFIDRDGVYRGLTADYLQLIGRRAGLNFETVVTADFAESVEKVQQGDAEMLSLNVMDEESIKHYLFSEMFVDYPTVLLMRRSEPSDTTIKTMAGRRVAVPESYPDEHFLSTNYPEIVQVTVPDIATGMRMVSLGEVDGVTAYLPTATSVLEREGISNLRLAGDTGMDTRDGFAVRRDLPLLRSILDKGLASITPEERQTIHRRWIALDSDENIFLDGQTIQFTAKEKAWLAEHPNITLGGGTFIPWDYVDDNGRLVGIASEYANLIGSMLGVRIKHVSGAWEDIHKKAKNRKIDGIRLLVKNEAREEYLNFTKPLTELTYAVLVHQEVDPLQSLSDLAGKKVAMVRRSHGAKYIADKYPGIHVVAVSTYEDGINALLGKKVDAFLGPEATITDVLTQKGITNLKTALAVHEMTAGLSIGIRKDWPELIPILNKVLDAIPAEKHIKIRRKWLSLDILAAKKLPLTAEEKTWLAEHKRMRLGIDPAWPPVEWIDEKGRYQGVTSEYTGLISDMLGLQIAPVERMSWTEVLERTKRGEIDMIPAIAASPQRSKYLNFTKPYHSFPFVIFTRDDAPLITELRDIYGKRVAVEESYVSYEYLSRDHPEIKITTYKTTLEILQALSLGEIDAYVGNLTVASYLIKKSGYTNIKVTAPTPYSFDLSIGVRKDWPELIPILENALSMIDEEQRNEIRQKWLALHYEVGVDYELVKRVAIGAIIVILFILLWILSVYRKDQMLQEAKAETDEINEAYHLANDQLIQANSKLKELDQMKSMFIASISHELRTPLNSIIGFSSMMMRGSFGELNEKYQDYITRVNHSGQHLLELITDIIDISKIEAGRVDVLLANFELKEAVAEAVEGLGQQIEQKGLSLEVNVPQGMAMHTDKRRLYQCLLNLLSNAVKYTEHGGIVLTAEKQGEDMLLKIRDSGIGVSKADQKYLFEAFERMESHLKIKAGGTGLGLYLTRKIAIELLQGEVGVESRLGEGSTFWIRVPMTIAPRSTSISKEVV